MSTTNSPNKKVAITGGSGFIGRYLYENLKANEAVEAIHNLDLVTPTFDFQDSFTQGDVRNAADCKKACQNADVVVHLAAAHKDFGIERDEYFDVNENGTRVLLEAMDELNIRKLIFTSSVAIYDPAETRIDENTIPSPQNPYGASKLAAEKVIENWLELGDGREAIVVRPTVVIGPRNQATMYSLIDQIYRGKYLFHLGKGDNVKSVAVVNNLVDFITGHITDQLSSKGSSPTIFVDSPQMPTREIIELIHQTMDKKLPSVSIPLGLAALLAIPFDLGAKLIGKHSPITPARVKKLGTQTKFESIRLAESGHKSRLSTREGIQSMVLWYLE